MQFIFNNGIFFTNGLIRDINLICIYFGGGRAGILSRTDVLHTIVYYAECKLYLLN